MTQLLRGQRRQERGDAGSASGLTKRDPDRGGAIARTPDYRREIERVFDRLLRDFDRDPLAALARLPDRLSNLVQWPPIDIAEDDRALTIRVDVPGLNPDNLNVEVSGNVLTIRGEREDEWSENERGVVRRERVSGTFARAITLPSYVDPTRIEATYDNGTLTISVPKIEGRGPRQVQVTSAGGSQGGSGDGGGRGRGQPQQASRQTTTGGPSTGGGQPGSGPQSAATGAQTTSGGGGGGAQTATSGGQGAAGGQQAAARA